MTEETSKYPNLELMDGSASIDSYAIFHKTPTHQMGIRPIIEAMPKGTYLGFRLRVVPRQKPDYGDSNVTPLSTGSHAEAYPAFEFQKENDERASLMGGMFLNRNLQRQPEEILEYIQEFSFVRALTTSIKAHFADQDLLNEMELNEWLHEQYFSQIEPFVEKAKEEAIFFSSEPVPVDFIFGLKAKDHAQYKEFYEQVVEDAKKPNHLALVHQTDNHDGDDTPPPSGKALPKFFNL